MNELCNAPAALRDPNSIEMIRVQIAEQKLHCVLRIGFWEKQEIDEPNAWGILIADMIRHIADAHEAEYGRDPRETMIRVREAFEAEIEHPTSGYLGEFVSQREED